MKILKIIAIILVNLLLLLILLVPVEIYYLYKWQGHLNDNPKKFIKNIVVKRNIKIDYKLYIRTLFHSISADKYFDMLYSKQVVDSEFTKEFRPDENIDSNKKPVVFIGCSFTWGDNINEDETVSSQFAKLTGRPTYNRGGSGWGLSHLLYQTKRDDFYTQFKEEPEYLFYIYIENQNLRLDKFKITPDTIDFQPKYIKKEGHLVEQKPRFYDRLFFVQNYQFHYNDNRNKVDNELVKLYFTETRDEIRKHWQNTKLVILIYPIPQGSMEDSLQKDLKKEGYTVIDVKKLVDVDLTDDKYKCDDKWHPSAEAWQIIIPKVIEKLGIK